MESLIESSQERRSTSNDNRVVESFPNIYVTFLDRVDDHFVHAWPLKTNLVWAE
jgi:hypothetical protein